MELWIIIVSIFGGINTIIAVLSVIYAAGKKPFIKAKKHKDQHSETEAKLKTLEIWQTTYKCDADLEHEKIRKDAEKEVSEVRQDTNEIFALMNKRFDILEMALAKANKRNDVDFYVLVQDDLTIFDTLLARGMNGPIKTRKEALEAHFLKRVFNQDSKEEEI